MLERYAPKSKVSSVENFPCLRQQTDWSCLPTAVFCVLEYAGQADVSMDQVAGWCRVRPGGACVWLLSLQGLGEALQGEFDVEDVEGDWAAVREAVEENDEPVIVTIANPCVLVELVGVHAVVVIGIGHFKGDEEQVMYMDPAIGRYESKGQDEFLAWWDVAGKQGFLLRP